MDKLTCVLEAVNRWHADDINGMIETALGGTSKDHLIFRTAHMMDSGRSDQSLFGKFMFCCKTNNDDNTNRQYNQQEQPPIVQQPLPDVIQLNPIDLKSAESSVATSEKESIGASQKKPSEDSTVSDDQQEENEEGSSNAVKEREEEQKEDNEAAPRRWTRPPLVKQENIAISSSSSSGQSTKRSVTPPKEEKEQPKRDEDDDNEPRVSSPLRTANAWFEQLDVSTSPTIYHHADLFNSAEFDEPKEESFDYFEAFCDKFSDNNNFGF